MAIGATTISSKSISRSSGPRLTTKNAWARYVRRRWPNNGVKGAMVEWGLTEGEAKGLLYAQVSQPTIDKILDHPRGGFALGLEILAVKTETSLEQYIETQAKRARDEQTRWEAEERVAKARLARLAECRQFAGRGDQPPR